MRLIDADELSVRSIDETDLPKDKGLLVVLKEDIDNAPTVEPKKEIVPVCKVTFNKEQLQEIVDKKVAEMIERPQGEWKLHGMIYYCSECGHDCEQGGNNFCGNCGADMRGEEE